MTPEIDAAVEQLKTAFEGCSVDVVDDGQGGVFVTIQGVPLDGGPYLQTSSWLGFHITNAYPYADVYPHFVRADLSRRDGKPLGEATSLGMFRNQQAVQVSRKANKLNPATDTAALKAQKVLRWLKSR
jgi:hypothetical protein